MITLAIHTASSRETVAVINKKITEVTWTGNKDESEKLLPAIERVLSKAGVNFGDLTRIVVTSGPGPFSSLRIGVTTANVLGFALGIPVQSLSSIHVWRARLPKKYKKAILLVFAGGSYVAHQANSKSKVEVRHLEEVLNDYKEKHSKTPLVFFGDLTENGAMLFEQMKSPDWKWIDDSELEPFGSAIKDSPSSSFSSTQPVTPLYFRPPNITRPK